MRKPGILVLLCVFAISSLTGCFDAREIDQWAYVYTIGVDKGVSNQLRFTFQIPSLKQESGGGKSGGSGGQAGEQKNYTTISVDAPTFFAGVNMAESSFSRMMNYMHAKYLVISEELAREGVERFLNGMVRSRQIRRIMYILIVKGKASEYVGKLSPLLTGAISKAQEGFMSTNKDTGLFIQATYHNFIKDLKTTYRMPAAPLTSMNDFSNFKESGDKQEGFKSEGDYIAGELPRKGGNDFEFIGTALFDGDKMVGELNGDETRVMSMIRGEFQKASIAIADPKNSKLRITIDTKIQKKPSIKVSINGDKPVIHVKLFLEGDLQNLQSPTEYESVKLKPVLENAFKAYIKGLLDKTVDKCKSLHVDVFGFGEKAVMHFLTIQEWEAYNWKGKFKDAQVTTEVDFTIRRTGTLLKTNPTRNSHSKGENK
ncbi:MAG: Ger(x)C family spore germination protein [Clostridia bacterium]|nr:Ger(x)C family spore germination protein [Clostridia bacterium]